MNKIYILYILNYSHIFSFYFFLTFSYVYICIGYVSKFVAHYRDMND